MENEKIKRRKSKKPAAGSSIILREQIQLLKAEKELQEALKTIGQYKNRLIVGILVIFLQYLLHIFCIEGFFFKLFSRLKSLS